MYWLIWPKWWKASQTFANYIHIFHHKVAAYVIRLLLFLPRTVQSLFIATSLLPYAIQLFFYNCYLLPHGSCKNCTNAALCCTAATCCHLLPQGGCLFSYSCYFLLLLYAVQLLFVPTCHTVVISYHKVTVVTVHTVSAICCQKVATVCYVATTYFCRNLATSVTKLLYVLTCAVKLLFWYWDGCHLSYNFYMLPQDSHGRQYSYSLLLLNWQFYCCLLLLHAVHLLFFKFCTFATFCH